jgi:hypothetical protein
MRQKSKSTATVVRNIRRATRNAAEGKIPHAPAKWRALGSGNSRDNFPRDMGASD